ncbi:hypothetical protein WA685_21995, partial [Xanthomonas arboricola pv. pruni]
PPSSVSNINRRPLVLAGIELRGVDIGSAGRSAAAVERGQQVFDPGGERLAHFLRLARGIW